MNFKDNDRIPNNFAEGMRYHWYTNRNSDRRNRETFKNYDKTNSRFSNQQNMKSHGGSTVSFKTDSSPKWQKPYHKHFPTLPKTSLNKGTFNNRKRFEVLH